VNDNARRTLSGRSAFFTHGNAAVLIFVQTIILERVTSKSLDKLLHGYALF